MCCRVDGDWLVMPAKMQTHKLGMGIVTSLNREGHWTSVHDLQRSVVLELN
jgi:hypothetical protein